MAAILKDDPPAIADTGVQVPAELARVIERCLAKNPAQRFHSAHDLAFALRGILSGTSEKPRRQWSRLECVLSCPSRSPQW